MKQLILVIPEGRAPVWFNRLASHLEANNVRIEIVCLNIGDPKMSSVFLWFFRRLHQVFGYKTIDYCSQAEGKVEIQFTGNPKEIANYIEKSSIQYVLNLCKSFEGKLHKLSKIKSIFTSDTLAWSAFTKDIIFEQWLRGERLHRLSVYHLSGDGIKNECIRFIGPSGRLSLWNARQNYADLAALADKLFGADPDFPANKAETAFPDAQNTISLGRQLILEIYMKCKFRIKKPRWILAYGLSADAKCVPGNLTVLFPPKRKEWADPFLYIKDGVLWIFAEQIDEKGFGSLIAFPANNSNSKVSILPSKHHTSYPFLFEEDGELYMIPERSAGKELALYHCTEFPEKWERHHIIRSDMEFVDASLLYFGKRYWIFTNSKQYAATYNEELHIFYSDNLDGDWQAHRANPIKLDARFSRPAGSFIHKDGNLYRPVQDCSRTYGEKIHWMKIEKLDKDNFVETWDSTIEPNWYSGLTATHTFSISQSGIYTILDGYYTG